MKIYINKKEFTLDGAPTLADALAHAEMTAPGIAAAIGNRVIRRADWTTTQLADGMEITVISAVCGG
ncbi:MAG: sulfur carrier protein ThiS [Muribaculaceae bacterium]|nr:sulfur carrier protein ThiS [Muribaculaceae bacterium]MCI9053525.1 sulfur carrier protein ThiS [Muribaculaceae bacterium]